jgi:hypothetical protein
MNEPRDTGSPVDIAGLHAGHLADTKEITHD